MKRQAFQYGEIRDEHDNIIQAGSYGKKSPFANKDNTAILDYIINNFQALFDMISGAYVYVDTEESLPETGDEFKFYVTKDDGKTYRWDGEGYVLVTASVDGLSAYEIAVQKGFEGSEDEWLASLTCTITSATVDNHGNMILHLNNGQSVTTPLQPIIEAMQYVEQAKQSAAQASQSASEASRSAVEAKTSETTAQDSADKAKESENNAKTSEEAAKASEISAQNSEDAANASATAAKESETNAAQLALTANAAKDVAQESANSATESETNAAESASNALKSEGDAADSAKLAQEWAESSESPSNEVDSDSDTGKTQSSKTWALYSKGKALYVDKYATAAKESETNAAVSEANAKQYRDEILSNVDKVTQAVSNAQTYETNAKKSADSAAASASAANQSASNASASESHAAQSETNAQLALTESQKIAQQVEEALKKVTGASKYCGSVDNYSELEEKNNNVGDIWNVANEDKEHGIKAGDNVIWNGESWDNLSGFIDLSNYPTNLDVAKAIVSVTYSGASITFIHKDSSQTTVTLNDVEHAMSANQDGDGNNIVDTYETKNDADTKHTEIQNSIGNIEDGTTIVGKSKNALSCEWTNVSNKPNFSTVAISGSYNDLTDAPSPIDTSGFATLAGTQTFTGNNTFQGTFTVTTSKTSASGSPSSDNHISNKKYVDDTVNNVVTNITNGTTIVGKAKDSLSCEWTNVKNKPTLAAVATSGSYGDLKDTPAPIDTSGFATLAGTQTLTGNKTFTGTTIFNGVVTVGAPVSDASATPKKYVDDAIETAISNIVNGDEVAY